MTDEYLHPTPDDADEIVDRAIESDGGLVIRLDRIGATPYMRFTPYTNHRGVRCHHWTCLSNVPKPMPGKTLLFRPTLVDPADYDGERPGYPLRHFSTPWVWEQVWRSRIIKLLPAEETPFAGDAWRYNWEDGE